MNGRRSDKVKGFRVLQGSMRVLYGFDKGCSMEVLQGMYNGSGPFRV